MEWTEKKFDWCKQTVQYIEKYSKLWRQILNEIKSNNKNTMEIGFNEQKHVSRDEWVISRLQSVIQFHWKVDLCISLWLYITYVSYVVRVNLNNIWWFVIHACTQPLTNTHIYAHSQPKMIYRYIFLFKCKMHVAVEM